MINKEIEFKTLLSREDFHQVEKTLGISSSDFLLQSNTYFDSPNYQLRANNAILRIREKANNYEVTIKIQREKHAIEFNESLAQNDYDSLHQTIKHLPEAIHHQLAKLDIDHLTLHCIGQLHTWRAEKETHGGRVALDKNEYLGMTDYELEFEVTNYNEGYNQFQKLLETIGVSYNPANPKIARFMKRKNERS